VYGDTLSMVTHTMRQEGASLDLNTDHLLLDCELTPYGDTLYGGDTP
jgi:hypothetical protein